MLAGRYDDGASGCSSSRSVSRLSPEHLAEPVAEPHVVPGDDRTLRDVAPQLDVVRERDRQSPPLDRGPAEISFPQTV
ncbi:hypothetical protein [Pseudonocardia sp. DLS-67]